jgi:hypothetical protein
MEFFINKNNTLPILKMQLVKDGINSISGATQIIEKSIIYFSMKNVEDGSQKILNKKGGFVEKIFIEPNASTEYYVYYKFTSSDTSREGLYEGEFVFITDTGTYILPIREKLTIKIGNSYVSI